MTTPAERLLDPATVARLGRLRLALRRRVEGRYAGGHRARGFGSSQDFADYREYTPGDDPRLLDPHAYARHGKRLVKLYAAEDTAAVRVVVDCSASMGFGGKRTAALRVAAALAAVTAAGGDRVRVLLAGESIDAGPWFAGPATLPAVEARLRAAPPPAGGADLTAALRRAHGEGPRGPVVLVSDLLAEGWEEAVRLLGSRRTDAVLVHLLGRDELVPPVRGDVRLFDAETGAEVELAVAGDALDRYRQRLASWLEEVRRACGARGVAYARHADDEPLDGLITLALPRLGLVGR